MTTTRRPDLRAGLPPIIGGNPRVLILGNAPSVMSLTARQYYGNPRNGFWRITGEVFGFDPAAPYDTRVAALIARGVAVWDVLSAFRRAGSLDSAVERNSMVANDFAPLYAAHGQLSRVYFNGAAAEDNYRRLVTAESSATFVRLPSTSPANTMALADKLAAWRVILSAERA